MYAVSFLRLFPTAWVRPLVTSARLFDLRRAVQLAHVEGGLPQPLRGQRLLEAGSGVGLSLFPLAVRGAAVTGVDTDPRSVAIASRLARALRISDARFQVATLRSLPFRDRSFDVVIAAEALDRADDDVSALKELGRVLRPGGLLALTVGAADRSHPLINLLPREWLRSAAPARRFNATDLRQKLELLGFEVVDTGPCLTGVGAIALDAFARVRALDPATPTGRLLYRLLSPVLYIPAMLSDALGQGRRGYGLRVFAVRRSDAGGPPRTNGNGHGLALKYTAPLEQPTHAVGRVRA